MEAAAIIPIDADDCDVCYFDEESDDESEIATFRDVIDVDLVDVESDVDAANEKPTIIIQDDDVQAVTPDNPSDLTAATSPQASEDEAAARSKIMNECVAKLKKVAEADGGGTTQRASGTERVSYPPFARLAAISDQSLEMRQMVAKAFGGCTVKVAQVKDWAKHEAALLTAYSRNTTLFRVVDPRRKGSPWKPLWDAAYKTIVEWAKNGERISRLRVKHEVRRLAVAKGHPVDKVCRRIPKFRQRYGVTFTKACRIRKDTPEVALAKVRSFHWFIAAALARFPSLTLDDIVNADECPMSASGCMDSPTEVATFVHEGVQLKNPDRAVQHSILDEKYRIGTFLPFLGRGRPDPIGFCLFAGNPKHPAEEKKHYSQHVKVVFNDSGSLDESFMLNELLPFWKASEGPTPRVRLLFMDHHRAHFTERVLARFAECRTIIVRIPKSMTSVLQALDVYVFARFRSMYVEEVDTFVADHPNHKPTAMEKRSWCTLWCANAFRKVSDGFRYSHCFEQLGMWRPDPPECGIKLRAMPEYVFDASWLPASDVIASAQVQFAAVSAALELSAAVLPPTSTSASSQARPIAKLARGANEEPSARRCNVAATRKVVDAKTGSGGREIRTWGRQRPRVIGV